MEISLFSVYYEIVPVVLLPRQGIMAQSRRGEGSDANTQQLKFIKREGRSPKKEGALMALDPTLPLFRRLLKVNICFQYPQVPDPAPGQHRVVPNVIQANW